MQVIQVVGSEDNCDKSDNLKQMPGDLFSLYQTLSFFEDSVDPSSSSDLCPSISSCQYSPFLEVATCGQQVYEHNVTQYLANWIVRCLHARECPTRELCHIPGCGLLERILMHIPNCVNCTYFLWLWPTFVDYFLSFYSRRQMSLPLLWRLTVFSSSLGHLSAQT